MDPDTFRHRRVDIAIGRDAEIKDFCRIRTSDHPQCSSPKQSSTIIILLQHGLYEGRPASKILLIPQTGKGKIYKVRCYVAQYPVRVTTQTALHFTPWQIRSFRHQLNFSGKHSAMLQLLLLREDYSLTFPLLSIARYSFI